MNFNKQAFSENLAKLMVEGGFTRPKLQQLTGLSKATLHNLLTSGNPKTPDIDTFLLLSGALGVSLEQLINHVGDSVQPRAAIASLIQLVETLPISITTDPSNGVARLVTYDLVLCRFLDSYRDKQRITKDPAERRRYRDELLSLSTYSDCFLLDNAFKSYFDFFLANGCDKQCAEKAVKGYQSLCNRYGGIMDSLNRQHPKVHAWNHLEVSRLLLSQEAESLGEYSIEFSQDESQCIECIKHYINERGEQAAARLMPILFI